jgi:nitrite reductase (NO-forming)
VLAAATGVAAHGIRIHLDAERGRWTTDAGWHHLTAGALLAGQAWLGIGLAIAAARALTLGAGPAGWSLAVLIGPLIVGGVAQILVGAMTHLLPAIGPGDPFRHAAQRRILGAGAILRLTLLNAGALAITVGSGPLAPAGPGSPGAAPGTPAGLPLVAIGLGLAAAGLGASLALLGLAAVRRPASRQPIRPPVGPAGG